MRVAVRKRQILIQIVSFFPCKTRLRAVPRALYSGFWRCDAHTNDLATTVRRLTARGFLHWNYRRSVHFLRTKDFSTINMSSSVARASKYSYRSTGGTANADVSIEYSADLTALSRLEVNLSGSAQRIKTDCAIMWYFCDSCAVLLQWILNQFLWLFLCFYFLLFFTTTPHYNYSTLHKITKIFLYYKQIITCNLNKSDLHTMVIGF